MTVKELIELLSEYPLAMKVIIDTEEKEIDEIVVQAGEGEVVLREF